jgi:hypothetical protein
MPTTRVSLLNRLNSLCAAAPFSLTQAKSPFDFGLQPSGTINQCFRIEAAKQGVIGGLNYSSEDTDEFTIWIARKENAEPQAAYRALVTDVTSLTAAIVRDGSTGGGDFSVPDGGGVSFQHDNGLAYAVARLVIPINYETQL